MKPTFDHLHLGCGTTIPDGWLNADGSWQVLLAQNPVLKHILVGLRLLPRKQAEIPWKSTVLRLNVSRPLPFANGSFQVVYCSHTLEHLYHGDALKLLKECHRVLNQGGICRFVVPDLEAIVHDYLDAKRQGKSEAATRLMQTLMVHDKQPPRSPLDWFHWMTAYHQHKWMYDGESLIALFREAGFSNARQVACFESRIKRIAEVEDPGRVLKGAGIVVEASRE